MKIIAFALLVILWTIVGPMLLGRKWRHDHMGWGYPTKRDGGDSFQPAYSCEFCDYALCQDSQGNWFHLSRKSVAAPTTPSN